MSKLDKREGPDPVDPVELSGLRIEAVHFGHEVGETQNGGIIAAYDVGTGERAWTLKVYDVAYDANRERDVQDVFITRLSVDPERQLVRVVDEEGRVHLVDPAKRRVVD